MTSPTPPPPTPTPVSGPSDPAPPASHRTSQVALAIFLAFLLGLLAFRGYGPRLGSRPTELVTARYDLNHADRSELEQIPGVGPKLAQAIDDHRRENGPFRSVEDLRGVRGVGPATLDKVRPYLRVEITSPPAAGMPSPDPDPPLTDRKRPAPAAITPAKKPDAAPAPRPSGVRKLQPGDPPINVNTSPVEDLQRLPSVGPVTAQHIAAARAERPFRSLADLDRVKGIGPKMLDKLRPFVVVE
ncbi:MAG: comEA [Gemmataceae bacterium]|nr:comEA [Gemmataceae bacterium]